MKNSTLLVVIVLCVGSCTAQSVANIIANGNMDPATACVNRAWGQSDRIECVKSQTPRR